MIEAVDLFCGSGGLTCGLRQYGMNVLAGVDSRKNVNTHTKRITARSF